MYKYLMASVGLGRDEAKIQAYSEGTVEHFDWLVAQGVPLLREGEAVCSGCSASVRWPSAPGWA